MKQVNTWFNTFGVTWWKNHAVSNSIKSDITPSCFQLNWNLLKRWTCLINILFLKQLRGQWVNEKKTVRLAFDLPPSTFTVFSLSKYLLWISLSNNNIASRATKSTIFHGSFHPPVRQSILKIYRFHENLFSYPRTINFNYSVNSKFYGWKGRHGGNYQIDFNATFLGFSRSQ